MVCNCNTLRGSAVQAEDDSNRCVAEVTDYSRALGVALAQTTYDIGECSEWADLKELLSSLELENMLIQADTLHTTRPFFSGAWSRRLTCSRPSNRTKRPSSIKSALSFRESVTSLSLQAIK